MTSEWFVTDWCLTPQCLFFYIFENIIRKHEMALNPVRSFCNEKQNSTVEVLLKLVPQYTPPTHCPSVYVGNTHIQYEASN
jgi:hypothetical protein